MSFAEKGAVSDIEPAFFVGYLHRVQATGTLKFEDAPVQRAVYFRDGRVLFCSSNAPDDQLGAILVAGGKISQAQFDATVAGLEPKQSIAAALAQGGHVSQRDIGDAARRKVEQIIGACCAQTSGSYEFEDGVLPKGALDLKLTTEKVLVSAFEVLEPSGFLNRILKSPMAVLAAGEVDPSDADLVRLKAAFDGVSSLADIGGSVGLPLAATEARAAVLVVMGAASVVTSQIEEMALPEIHEAAEEMPSYVADDSEPVEAATIAFAQSPSHAETIAFGGSAPIGSGLGDGSGVGSDSTLILSGGGVTSPDPFAGGGEATLVMGQGFDLQAEPDSGLVRSSGVPRRERPSTQDLDAVKELIGTPASKPSASMPSERWDPVLSTEGRPGRKRPGAVAILQSPLFQRIMGVLVLGLFGTAGWLWYTRPQNPPAGVARAVASPESIALATPMPTTSSATLPPPVATPTTSPVALPAPSAPASSLPSATSLPSAPATPKAVEKPVSTPSPKASATPAPTTVVKSALPAAATPAVAAGAGYAALKAGRLPEAAAVFEKAAGLRSNEFSVQILVACSPQTIEKALQNDPSPDLFIVPATISGKSCHRLMRGYFKTQAEAAQVVATLPGYYAAEGARPRAVSLKTVLR